MKLEIPVTPNINMIHGTPILMGEVPNPEAMNQGLMERILAVRERDRGVQVSNYGGWQSEGDLWNWEGEAFDQYRFWVHDCIIRMAALVTEEIDPGNVDVSYRAASWANVNHHGDYNARHIHPDVDWAVVYYVSVGTPGDANLGRNGRLELHDSRFLAQSSNLAGYGFGLGLLVDPLPGKIVQFPAWVEHSVHPFYGEGTRISIACNVKITGGRHVGLK